LDDSYLIQNIEESVAHSWYEDTNPRHPWRGVTKPKYTDFSPDGKYSWCKAPRFKGKPTQVGPLAQILAGIASKHPLTLKWVNYAMEKAKTLGLSLEIDHFHSTMGRHLARAIRACMLADLSLKHLELLEKNIAKGDLSIYNEPIFPRRTIKGVGFHEAPRGTLSHWVVIRNGVIQNYQCVVPSTWNIGPRDEKGQRGPCEEALIGNPVVDLEKPLEVLRTVHSFDPCIACAVHILNNKKQLVTRVKAL